MSSNLHYLFHTEYYENIKLGKIEVKDKKKTVEFLVDCTGHNDSLKKATFVGTDDRRSINAAHIFTLRTTYPGLMLGLGYPHDPGGSKEAIQLGFTFDFVTGMPYIPGSTVKGVLRSAFRNYPDVVKEKASDSIKKVDLQKLETYLRCLRGQTPEVIQSRQSLPGE